MTKPKPTKPAPTGPLRLTDAQFWTEPHRTEDAILDELSEKDFVGALLDGPARVDLERRSTLPLHGIWASTYRDNAQLDFDRQALVVAVRLESGQVFVERAMELKAARRTAPAGEETPPEGTTLRSFHLDLRRRLPLLPWRPGTLLVTLLVRDRTSNRVRVELRLGGDLAQDPDVKAFLDRHRRHAWPQPVYPPSSGGKVPGYRRTPETPPAPAGHGIALACDRVNVVPAGDLGGSVVVRGSFRLPLLDRFIVRPPEPAPPAPPPAAEPPPPADDEEPRGEPELTEADERALRSQAAREAEERGLGLVFQDPRDRQARAIVPITLVVVPADWVEPQVVPLQVPVHDAIDPARPPADVAGQFAIDLLDLPRAAAIRGRSCFLYAFAGEVMTGPVPLSIVRADELRPS